MIRCLRRSTTKVARALWYVSSPQRISISMKNDIAHKDEQTKVELEGCRLEVAKVKAKYDKLQSSSVIFSTKAVN